MRGDQLAVQSRLGARVAQAPPLVRLALVLRVELARALLGLGDQLVDGLLTPRALLGAGHRVMRPYQAHALPSRLADDLIARAAQWLSCSGLSSSLNSA